MTCLYCGKKLGFFSRYKDTPFCSEEHLRAHQDEMERALMERLGSKISAQSGQRDLAREETPGLDAKAGRGKSREAQPLEDRPKHFDAPLDVPPPARGATSSPRRGEVRNFPNPDAVHELAPTPAAERPIDKRALMEGRNTPPPPPPAPEPPAEKQTKRRDDEPREGNICEDFFEGEHQAVPALDPTKPWLAPSTFAIIVQADFCTPSLPDVSLQFEPAPVEEEFTWQPDAAAPPALEAAPPAAAPAADFPGTDAALPQISGSAPTGMPTVASLAGSPSQDIWEAFPAEDNLFEIGFNAPPAARQPGASLPLLGGRPEVPLRPRHRYPYPGSDLQTRWNAQAHDFGALPFTSAEEWAPVEPQPHRNVLAEQIEAERAEIQPQLEVQLSLSALCAQVIREEDQTPFERDPQSQPLASLPATAGLYADSALGDWALTPSLPRAATPWQPHFRFPHSAAARPMPAVNFPSLFQLNPAMPPRPEGVLHG